MLITATIIVGILVILLSFAVNMRHDSLFKIGLVKEPGISYKKLKQSLPGIREPHARKKVRRTIKLMYLWLGAVIAEVLLILYVIYLVSG